MDRLRHRSLWFLIWLFLPVAGAVAAGIWYRDAGRPVTDATPSATTAPAEDADQLPPAEPPPGAESPAPVTLPARMLARGDLGFPFLAYETFGPGRIALGAPAAAGNVAVLVAEFKNGTLQPVSQIQEPMGAILDLTRGDLLNSGEIQAVVTTEKGLLILRGTEKYSKQEAAGLERVFVGDWDNDGRSEAAILHKEKGARQIKVMRYTPDGKGATLGAFPSGDFPAWSAVLDRPGQASLLMGAERSGASVNVAFYSLDPVRGLQVTARYPLRFEGDQAIASFAAGDVAGRPALAVSFRSDPSFLELFDTAAEGMPSRGRIMLPDDEVYMVLLGTFSGRTRTELLAITPQGEWMLFGLD